MAATDSFFALIGAHQRGTAIGLKNGENPRLKNPLLLKSSQSSASSTQHMRELLAGNSTAVPPPVNQSKGYTYTNPWPSHYLTHAHSHITLVGSHEQRFCPHWGSTAWHGHRSVTGKTCVQRPFTAEVSPLQCKCQFHTTQSCGSCWLGTTLQLYHNMCGEGGSQIWCMCARCFNLSLENSELNCSTIIKNLKSRLYAANFSRYWSLCFCPKLQTSHFA